MAIANLAMAERGVEFAKAQDSPFIIQQVGLNHVFGTALYDCSYEDCLTSAYRNSSAAPLPVFTTDIKSDFGLNILPEAAYNALPNSIVIEGTSTAGFTHREKDQETVEIARLNEHSGAAIETYDVAEQKEHYKNSARNDADAVIARYKKAQANTAPRF
jgi:hypothetical protein